MKLLTSSVADPRAAAALREIEKVLTTLEAKPAVSGSNNTDIIQSLLAALVQLGLITDSTT